MCGQKPTRCVSRPRVERLQTPAPGRTCGTGCPVRNGHRVKLPYRKFLIKHKKNLPCCLFLPAVFKSSGVDPGIQFYFNKNAGLVDPCRHKIC